MIKKQHQLSVSPVGKFLPLMKSFNKSEAAIFPIQPVLQDYIFFLSQNNYYVELQYLGNTYLHLFEEEIFQFI